MEKQSIYYGEVFTMEKYLLWRSTLYLLWRSKESTYLLWRSIYYGEVFTMEKQSIYVLWRSKVSTMEKQSIYYGEAKYLLWRSIYYGEAKYLLWRSKVSTMEKRRKDHFHYFICNEGTKHSLSHIQLEISQFSCGHEHYSCNTNIFDYCKPKQNTNDSNVL